MVCGPSSQLPEEMNGKGYVVMSSMDTNTSESIGEVRLNDNKKLYNIIIML